MDIGQMYHSKYEIVRYVSGGGMVGWDNIYVDGESMPTGMVGDWW